MKRSVVVAVGMCVLGLGISGLSDAGDEAPGSMIVGQVTWVNPDGSFGVGVGRQDANSQVRGRNVRDWVNPDGSRGTADESDRGPSLAGSSRWMNPDGVGGAITADINSDEPRRSVAVAAGE
ncbi:MAG: hypothetical protein NW703_03135 [Nitrospiraceae bacterium]